MASFKVTDMISLDDAVRIDYDVFADDECLQLIGKRVLNIGTDQIQELQAQYKSEHPDAVFLMTEPGFSETMAGFGPILIGTFERGVFAQVQADAELQSILLAMRELVVDKPINLADYPDGFGSPEGSVLGVLAAGVAKSL